MRPSTEHQPQQPSNPQSFSTSSEDLDDPVSSTVAAEDSHGLLAGSSPGFTARTPAWASKVPLWADDLSPKTKDSAKKYGPIIVGVVVPALIVLLLCLNLLRDNRSDYEIYLTSYRDLPCTTWPVVEANNGSVVFSDPSYLEELSTKQSSLSHTYQSSPNFTKPMDFRIVGVVFYGRREYVDILDCYLSRNLASNGGYLDEVQFLENTDHPGDLEWADELIQRQPEYSKYKVHEDCIGDAHNFTCLWTGMIDADTLYIKMDDDIIYLHEDAIPQLVQARLEHPEAIAVGAALINSHLLSWSYYHNGAVYPYLPEPANYTDSFDDTIEWRVSGLPMYPEDLITRFNGTRTGAEEQRLFDTHPPKPPFNGHRWLPLPRNGTLITETPIFEIDHSKLDIAQASWMVAAQQHYSFLERLENDSLDVYDVGDKQGIWHPQCRRYNINFIAVWGSDVRDNSPVPRDDEFYFSMKLCQDLDRPFLVSTRSLVSHLHFHPQAPGIRTTDLLDRYRAYANEFVCPKDRLRMPMAARCNRTGPVTDDFDGRD